MRVDTMLRKEKEGTLYKYTKLGSTMEERLQRLYEMRGLDENGELKKTAGVQGDPHGSDQASLNYRAGDPPHMTGYVYKSKKKKGDVPTRDEITAKTTSESRQEGQGTIPSGPFHQVEGYHDTGKTAGRKLATAPKTKFNFSLVGNPSDVPSGGAGVADDGFPKHLVGKHRLPDAFVSLSDLAPISTKLASRAAFVEELEALGGVLTHGQLNKLADTTKSEAEAALKRLRKLERNKPGIGEVARGALVGSIIGPAASLAQRAAAGKRGRMGFPIWLGGRAQIASGAHGAVFGGALPAGRHRLELEVEKQKLKEYVGHRRRGTLRSKIKKTLGV